MSDLRVMVAIRNPEHVNDLMSLACQLAQGMKAELMVLNVVEVGPALPLDVESEALESPGRKALERAAHVTSETFGGEAHTRLVRARDAGPAIVEQAAQYGADLLVLGYHGKHGLGEILLGSTVQYVAAHAPCRVIVQIAPASKGQNR